jgi:catechol 2,3-dioxygenase-like lactoylglutathione lyase family enzyme
MVNKKKSSGKKDHQSANMEKGSKNSIAPSQDLKSSPLKYMNAVIIVDDLERSKQFYTKILHLNIDADFGPNVSFIGGLSIWEKAHACSILGLKENQLTQSSANILQRMEYYFETEELDLWVKQMQTANVSFVHSLITQPWQQRVFRIKDPDNNIIEIGEPLSIVVKRLAQEGNTVDQICAKTSIPEPGVRMMLGSPSKTLPSEIAKSVPSKEILDYYVSYGYNTDPGHEIKQFKDLPSVPDNIPAICKLIQENFLHFFLVALFGKNLYGYTLADVRKMSREPMNETSVESIEQLLTAQKQLVLSNHLSTDTNYSLQSRPIHSRHFMICRTYAALLVSIMRSKGIAARVRCGFARYLNPGFYEDHYVCEYYHPTQQRWILVDSQLDDNAKKFMQISFDPCDVPRDMFVIAGDAWKQYKSGKIPGDKCGIMNIRCPEFIRGNVMIDFANLNKHEVQPWSNWGLKLKTDNELTVKEWDLIEEMADLTKGTVNDEEFVKIRKIYATNSSIRVPDGFKSPHFKETGVHF